MENNKNLLSHLVGGVSLRGNEADHKADSVKDSGPKSLGFPVFEMSDDFKSGAVFGCVSEVGTFDMFQIDSLERRYLLFPWSCQMAMGLPSL